MPKGRTFTVTATVAGQQHSVEVTDTDKPGAKSLGQRKLATSLKVKIGELQNVVVTETTPKTDDKPD